MKKPPEITKTSLEAPEGVVKEKILIEYKSKKGKTFHAKKYLTTSINSNTPVSSMKKTFPNGQIGSSAEDTLEYMAATASEFLTRSGIPTEIQTTDISLATPAHLAKQKFGEFSDEHLAAQVLLQSRVCLTSIKNNQAETAAFSALEAAKHFHRLNDDPASLFYKIFTEGGKKGGEIANVENKRLKQRVLKMYKTGTFPTRDAAADAIHDKLSSTSSITRDTIRNWLKNQPLNSSNK